MSMSPVLNMRKVPGTLELNFCALQRHLHPSCELIQERGAVTSNESTLFRTPSHSDRCSLPHKGLRVRGLGRKFERFPRFHSAIQFPDVIAAFEERYRNLSS